MGQLVHGFVTSIRIHEGDCFHTLMEGDPNPNVQITRVTKERFARLTAHLHDGSNETEEKRRGK